MPKKYTLAEEIGNGLYRVPVPRRVQILVPDWDRDQVRKNFKTLNFMNLQIISPGLHSNFQRLLGITSELWTPIYFIESCSAPDCIFCCRSRSNHLLTYLDLIDYRNVFNLYLQSYFHIPMSNINSSSVQLFSYALALLLLMFNINQ